MQNKYSIKASAVGLDMGEYAVKITARMTLSYAASISAFDDVYFNDARPEEIIAPPSFVVVLEMPLLMNPKYVHAIGFLNEDVMQETWLHVSQDSHFYDVIRPGDNLRVTGKIAQIRQTSAGALVVCRLQTKNENSGKLVAESWYGSLFRKVMIEGEQKTIYASPAYGSEVGLDGDGIKRNTYLISRGLPHIYGQCGNLWGFVHSSRKYALEHGLPDIILHGTCTWSHACMTIIREHANGNPSRIKRCGARFSHMVIPGTHIIVEHRATQEKKGRVNFDVRNGTGELALTHGIADIELK